MQFAFHLLLAVAAIGLAHGTFPFSKPSGSVNISKALQNPFQSRDKLAQAAKEKGSMAKEMVTEGLTKKKGTAPSKRKMTEGLVFGVILLGAAISLGWWWFDGGK
mmetsp:Transcript_8381/g.27647  ORF Transcript_8381/g.27647 Transcript_8381/m.27647 type:complete len:105 (+) Transcript_8381:52-366(+)